MCRGLSPWRSELGHITQLVPDHNQLFEDPPDVGTKFTAGKVLTFHSLTSQDQATFGYCSRFIKHLSAWISKMMFCYYYSLLRSAQFLRCYCLSHKISTAVGSGLLFAWPSKTFCHYYILILSHQFHFFFLSKCFSGCILRLPFSPNC